MVDTFVAGYAMARGVHVAWGDMDAMRACVEQASEDFEQVVEDPSSEPFERLAALQTWRWPRVESNHRTQIRSSGSVPIGRDSPRRSPIPKRVRPEQRRVDLGRSRWVWWPQRGPT